jgi:hypothetical protein
MVQIEVVTREVRESLYTSIEFKQRKGRSQLVREDLPSRQQRDLSSRTRSVSSAPTINHVRGVSRSRI